MEQSFNIPPLLYISYQTEHNSDLILFERNYYLIVCSMHSVYYHH
ncbi:hypothetical protein OENI_30045 [Oenococcus oeni]|nr:hypothetical protein OENI_30045 [Oenococcus oeni]